MPLPDYVLHALRAHLAVLQVAIQEETPGSIRRGAELSDQFTELAHFIVKEEEKAARDPWGEDPEYPRDDWRHAAGDNDTSLGYWDWVDHEREIAEDEENEDAG